MLIVAALVAYQQLRPSFRNFGELRTSVAGLERGAASFPAFMAAAIDGSNAAVARAQGESVAELDERIAALRRERARLSCGGDLAAAFRGGAGRVIENRKNCVRRALLDREVAALTAFRSTLDLRRPGEPLPVAVRRRTAIMRDAAAIERRSRDAIAAIDRRILGTLRFAAERRRLVDRADEARRVYRTAEAEARRLIAAQRRIDAGTAEAARAVATVRAELDAFVEDKGRELASNEVERVRGWAERVDLTAKMRTAALVLLGIVLSPYLIRSFLYFVLAPAAARRPAIRLRTPGAGGAAIPPAERSTTSVGVTLAPDEELLVRQDYLQASAVGGTKRTRWLLDWRHPLSSVAAGLTFLTRIRGAGELVTVSAVRDPFAEVAILTLPEDASLVLQPRALAAVAQPVGRPLRISHQWRLGSLNAWLTLQLRFLVFHGPARLVVKGGRGVRVEPASRGRIFGQDQLVGFGADLAYAVTRTETFWPYLFGRESLLKDRVADGTGILVVEEAPLAGRRAGVRRGLEGALDALLKVVGV